MIELTAVRLEDVMEDGAPAKRVKCAFSIHLAPKAISAVYQCPDLLEYALVHAPCGAFYVTDRAETVVAKIEAAKRDD